MKQYIREKVQVLKEFGIYLTRSELAHMKSLKTEIAIDNYARSIIMAKLEKGEDDDQRKVRRGFRYW